MRARLVFPLMVLSAVCFALMAILILTTDAYGAAPRPTIRWHGFDWNVYRGTGLLGQSYRAGNVTKTRTHRLHILVSGGTGGGVSMAYAPRYGYWQTSVTYRMTKGAGKYAILLFPESGTRPELDFAEDVPGDDAHTMTTANWHPVPGFAHSVRAEWYADFTRWHTVTVRCRAHCRLYMNGRLWTTFPNPHKRMRLAIQTRPTASSGRAVLAIARMTMRRIP